MHNSKFCSNKFKDFNAEFLEFKLQQKEFIFSGGLKILGNVRRTGSFCFYRSSSDLNQVSFYNLNSLVKTPRGNSAFVFCHLLVSIKTIFAQLFLLISRGISGHYFFPEN